MQGVFDSSEVDTTPGADECCPFSPPAGWEGGRAEYFELMRARYRVVVHFQRMEVTAMFARKYPFQAKGPFATEATEIITAMKDRLPKKAS
jgi:hypothetical protein